ncbi:hypothetical protein SAMN04487761_1425 [Lachnospiraceae bacterium C7]|nr:hypothetical protein SAMN04487761_1425 [Lachnospiraceae bacterium C7]
MSLFYPSEYLDSTYKIDFKRFYEEGYRAVLFDVDNTLVPHDAPADERAKKLFKELQDMGFKCMLVSNNKEPRVKKFSEVVKADYIYKAAKPLPKNYRKVMEKFGTTPKNTIMVGDQIFTDIMGGNLAKMKTILVKPIHPKEEIQIVLKRIPEKVILFFYKIHCVLFRRNQKQHRKEV